MALKILSRTIELTDGVGRWELFDMPESQSAVDHINKTITDSVSSGDGRWEVYSKAMATMTSYRHLGATDSEPMRHLDDVMDGIFGELNDY